MTLTFRQRVGEIHLRLSSYWVEVVIRYPMRSKEWNILINFSFFCFTNDVLHCDKKELFDKREKKRIWVVSDFFRDEVWRAWRPPLEVWMVILKKLFSSFFLSCLHLLRLLNLSCFFLFVVNIFTVHSPISIKLFSKYNLISNVNDSDVENIVSSKNIRLQFNF